MSIPVIPMEDELYINLDMRGTNIKDTEYAEHMEFVNCNFSGMDLRGVDFTRSTFDSCNMRNAKLDYSCLAGVSFIGTVVSGASFVGADLERASMHDMSANNVDFSEAVMIGFESVKASFIKTTFKNTLLSKAKFNVQRTNVWSGVPYQKSDRDLSKFVLLDMSNANFTGADLTEAEFFDCNLNGANFNKASLVGAKIASCLLNKTDLSNTSMQKSRLLNCQAVGANFWLANLFGMFVTNADMHGANFLAAKLGASLFKDCDLRFTVFSRGSTMQVCAFQGCDMQDINLSSIKMMGCDFNESDLTGSNLTYTVLNKGNFYNTNLTNANLRGASLRSTELDGANFTNANLAATNFTNACSAKAIFTKANTSGSTLNLPESIEPSLVIPVCEAETEISAKPTINKESKPKKRKTPFTTKTCAATFQ